MQASTINRYSRFRGGYSFEITFPANETNYLVALPREEPIPRSGLRLRTFNGNAVQGVTVNFSVQARESWQPLTGPTS